MSDHYFTHTFSNSDRVGGSKPDKVGGVGPGMVGGVDLGSIGMSYLPAQLKHITSEWLIEYYVLHPQSGSMVRKRMRLNKLRKRCGMKEFRERANEMVKQINNRLAGGWSPLMESDNLRLYTKLEDVVVAYLDEKRRELRPDTMRSYNSFCKHFVEYVGKSLPGIYASLFNRVHAISYMDTIYSVRRLSARSYNNNLKRLRALFSWAKEKCYVKENPFEQLKLKRVDVKRRVLIPGEVRGKISAWVREHDPGFLLVLQLVFSCLIRPKEIRGLRVRDLRLSEGGLLVPSDVSKNHKERYVVLTDEIIEMIMLLEPDRYSGDCYLISADWCIGSEPIGASVFDKHWDKVRIALELPQEMQLYSLKDSGITEMLEAGIASVSVMKHAGHHDLSMTTRYANHVDSALREHILSKAPKF